MSEHQKGIWYTIGAYFLWGILPIYWKALQAIPAGEILAHRIFWTFVVVLFVLIATRRLSQAKRTFASPKKLLAVALSGALISVNWFSYIWAVNHDQVIEASLGYYINPLFSFALGVLVLRESLSRWQFLSMLLAAIGVMILTVQFGQLPMVALVIALTFALYGLTKKLVELDSLVALWMETLMVFPIAALYLTMLQTNGDSSLGVISTGTFLLLASSGVITAIPLLWFAQGAKRIPYTMVSFIQYLSPSINLLIGVFLYKETFTWVHFISFSFIWAALVVYTLTARGGAEQNLKETA